MDSKKSTGDPGITEPILDASTAPGTTKTYTISDLSAIMRQAGFSDALVMAHQKTYQKATVDQARLDRTCSHYLNLVGLFDIIKGSSHDKVTQNTLEELYPQTMDMLLEEAQSRDTFNAQLSETQGLAGIIRGINSFLIEQKSTAELSQDSQLVEIFQKNYEEVKAQFHNFEMIHHERFGFWLSNLAFETFVADPKQRPAVRKLLSGTTRRHILSENVELKLKAAEDLKAIIEQIDVGEHTSVCRDALIERLDSLVSEYDRVLQIFAEVKTFSNIEIPPAEESVPVESPAAQPVARPLKARSRKKPINVPKPPDTTPTKLSHRQRLALEKQQRAAARREAEEKQAVAARQAELERLANEEKAQAAAEAARQAALEQAAAAAHQAQEDAEWAELLAEEAARIKEREVNPGVLTRLTKGGDKVNSETLSNLSPTDDDHSAAIAYKRLSDLLEVGECYHPEAEVTVLKPRDQSKVEIYLLPISDVPDDSTDPDDIIVLDGNQEGIAQYIGFRRDYERAIADADIQVKRFQEADDFTKLYYVMKYCRTTLQNCGIKRIFHFNRADIPIGGMGIIEELEKQRQKRSQPDPTELHIDH